MKFTKSLAIIFMMAVFTVLVITPFVTGRHLGNNKEGFTSKSHLQWTQPPEGATKSNSGPLEL